jgi:hypothetical protein
VIRRPQAGGWSVLVNLDNTRSVALSPTADLIWRAIDGRHDVAAVVALLRDTFADVPPSAGQDVQDLLAQLEKSGFVGRELAPLSRSSLRANLHPRVRMRPGPPSDCEGGRTRPGSCCAHKEDG